MWWKVEDREKRAQNFDTPNGIMNDRVKWKVYASSREKRDWFTCRAEDRG